MPNLLLDTPEMQAGEFFGTVTVHYRGETIIEESSIPAWRALAEELRDCAADPEEKRDHFYIMQSGVVWTVFTKDRLGLWKPLDIFTVGGERFTRFLHLLDILAENIEHLADSFEYAETDDERRNATADDQAEARCVYGSTRGVPR